MAHLVSHGELYAHLGAYLGNGFRGLEHEPLLQAAAASLIARPLAAGASADALQSAAKGLALHVYIIPGLMRRLAKPARAPFVSVSAASHALRVLGGGALIQTLEAALAVLGNIVDELFTWGGGGVAAAAGKHALRREQLHALVGVALPVLERFSVAQQARGGNRQGFELGRVDGEPASCRPASPVLRAPSAP